MPSSCREELRHRHGRKNYFVYGGSVDVMCCCRTRGRVRLGRELFPSATSKKYTRTRCIFLLRVRVDKEQQFWVLNSVFVGYSSGVKTLNLPRASISQSREIIFMVSGPKPTNIRRTEINKLRSKRSTAETTCAPRCFHINRFHGCQNKACPTRTSSPARYRLSAM